MAAENMPIILLAAGASRRMRGADKLLEKVGGIPLLRLQAEKARAVTTGPVLVALPSAPHPRHAALAGMDCTAVEVPDAAEGMNASLRRAFAALPLGTGCAMLLLVDLPDLTARDLQRVAGAVDLQDGTLIWRGATATGEPGHPIIFHADLFDGFATLTGDSGGREIVARAGGRIALVPLEGRRARRDLDTPEAWAEWRREKGVPG